MAENGGSGELTPKQQTVIAALIAGHTVQTAAKAASVGERTAQRWLTFPYFQTAYKAAQRQVFDQALQGLILKVDKAISTLDRNMSGEDVPASTQVRAAQIVLEQAIAVHKFGQLEQEIQELKMILHGQLWPAQ